MEFIGPESVPTQLPLRMHTERLDRTGQQLGNYRLLYLLADGGYADVYLGEHVHLGTHAAIKVLHARLAHEDLELFREEARLVARLRHPHIVSILDFDVEDDTPFLVMDYAPNGNLRQRHPRKSLVPPATILTYLRQIADALQYAHSEHIVHRDIKPENMLIGMREEILLSDFGIAIVERSSRSQTTQDIIGTLAYMSPEQLQGRPRQASDQYSLGVVVYEWLCGHCPFHGSIAEVAAQHISASPSPLRSHNPAISPEMEAVVLKALAKVPEERYANVLEFVDSFAGTIEQQPIQLNGNKVQPNLPFIPESIHLSATVQADPPSSLIKTAASHKGDQHLVARRTILMGAVGVAATGLLGGGIALITQAYLASAKQKPPKLPPTPYPPGYLLLSYFGHTDVVNTLAWSPQNGGAYIASGSNDHTVHVWLSSAGSDSRTAYSGHSNIVTAVAWSRHGEAIASASADKTVQVWQAFSSGNESTPYSYGGHSDVVNTIAWSLDNTRIASGSNDKTVQLWNAGDGSNPYTYSGHTDAVNTLAWSPDGTMIASGGNDRTIRIWQASNGSDIGSYAGHADAVKTLAWSPDGKYIASGGADKTVQVWEVFPRNLLVAYTQHTDIVTSLAWSPDGSQIASASDDGTVHLWRANADGTQLLVYRGHKGAVNSVAWSPDGTKIASASADKTVQIWQTS